MKRLWMVGSVELFFSNEKSELFFCLIEKFERREIFRASTPADEKLSGRFVSKPMFGNIIAAVATKTLHGILNASSF